MRSSQTCQEAAGLRHPRADCNLPRAPGDFVRDVGASGARPGAERGSALRVWVRPWRATWFVRRIFCLTSPPVGGSLYEFVTHCRGGWDAAAHQVKTMGLAEREGRRKEKRLFFNTSEATILLKTKADHFEKDQNKSICRPKSPPKCTSKSRFLPILNLILTPKGPNCRGLHGVSKLLRRAEIQRGWREALWSWRKEYGS